MKKFIITATMKNGDKSETTRHTFEGMQNCIRDIIKNMTKDACIAGDYDVINFTVEEKMI